MASSSATAAELRKISLAISKLKTFQDLSTKMGAMDNHINVVEPVLSSMGWNLRDPQVAHRDPTNNLTLLVTTQSGSGVAIETLKQNGSIGAVKSKAASLKEASARGIDWTVITNGADWWVYHKSNSDEPFVKFKIFSDDGASQLSLLAPNQIEAGVLSNKFDSETTDKTVMKAMNDAAGTPQFVDLVRKLLAKSKVKMTKEDVAASIERITSEDDAKPRTKKAAPKARTKTVTAPTKKNPNTTTSTSVEKPEWPDAATHTMTRKGKTSFIALDKKTGKSTILPGSIVALEEGKTIPKPISNIRSIAVDDGSLKKKGDVFIATREIKLDSPRSAAGFVAGTIVPDVSCWQTPTGRKMSNPKKAARTNSKNDETASTPTADQTDEQVSNSQPSEATVPDNSSQTQP